MGQGLLYEEMNLAQLWKLPVIYVCENNLYNEYTHYTETTAGDLAARAQAFGIHAETVDGQDVRAVIYRHDTLGRTCASWRRAGLFVVRDLSLSWPPCRRHQSGLLPVQSRRGRVVRRSATRSKLLSDSLLSQKQTEQAVLDQIQADVKIEIEAGMQFAINSPYPDVGQVDQHVYA